MEGRETPDPMDRTEVAGARMDSMVSGRRVAFPVVVRDASNATAVFLVDRIRAQALLPGDTFEVIEAAPGLAQVALGFVDYRDNDLGDYNEAMVVFFVRPTADPAAAEGTFIYALPVNQEFTCIAGRELWGFPKSVEKIEINYEGERARCRLEMDGALVFQLSIPTSESGSDMGTMEMVTYSYRDGRALATSFRQGGETSFPDPSTVELTLGDHPLAESLRALGLPSEAALATWTARMNGAFDRPITLDEHNA